jgi:molybdopterin-guanine dinucleotide biosynthesis protein A
MRSAIVLAGGHSARFGKDKGLQLLMGKTMIEYVYSRLTDVVDEVIVVVGSRPKEELYSKILNECTVTSDDPAISGPLAGVSKGLRTVRGRKAAITGCDMPFISRDLLSLLFETCQGYGAAIPRWPSGYVEPLHSVYDVASCKIATDKALAAGRVDLRAMVSNLQRVIYVSTEAIRRLDQDLTMFHNVNTAGDLREARRLLASQKLRQG